MYVVFGDFSKNRSYIVIKDTQVCPRGILDRIFNQ